MRFLKDFVGYLLTVLILSGASYLMGLPVTVEQVCGFTLALLVLSIWLSSVIDTGLIRAAKDLLDVALEMIEEKPKNEDTT